MLIKSKNGHIINIGSIASDVHYKTGHVYAASKAFSKHLTKCIRTEQMSDNLHITSINPGKVHTNFQSVKSKGKISNKDCDEDQQLRAVDIAETVSWVLSRPKNVNISEIEIIPALSNLSYR